MCVFGCLLQPLFTPYVASVGQNLDLQAERVHLLLAVMLRRCFRRVTEVRCLLVKIGEYEVYRFLCVPYALFTVVGLNYSGPPCEQSGEAPVCADCVVVAIVDLTLAHRL